MAEEKDNTAADESAPIPAGASKPAGSNPEGVSGGGEPSEAPKADHHDVAYRDRDPGIVNDGQGSVGSERPGQRVIKSENAGTLVEEMPDMREENPASDEPVNVGNPAPTQPVGRQPMETSEEAGKRINADRKTTRKASSKKS